MVARDTAPRIQQRLETAREQVRAIRESDPASTQHAQQARRAFTELVEVLETLRQQPHLQQADLQQHVTAARQSAEALNPGTPLLQQRATVQLFRASRLDISACRGTASTAPVAGFEQVRAS